MSQSRCYLFQWNSKVFRNSGLRPSTSTLARGCILQPRWCQSWRQGWDRRWRHIGSTGSSFSRTTRSNWDEEFSFFRVWSWAFSNTMQELGQSWPSRNTNTSRPNCIWCTEVYWGNRFQRRSFAFGVQRRSFPRLVCLMLRLCWLKPGYAMPWPSTNRDLHPCGGSFWRNALGFVDCRRHSSGFSMDYVAMDQTGAEWLGDPTSINGFRTSYTVSNHGSARR